MMFIRAVFACFLFSVAMQSPTMRGTLSRTNVEKGLIGVGVLLAGFAAGSVAKKWLEQKAFGRFDMLMVRYLLYRIRGYTLARAIQENNLNAITVCLDAGAVDLSGQQGSKLMLWAMENNNAEIALRLIEQGAPVDVRFEDETDNDLTLLHWAAARGHGQVVRVLLDRKLFAVNGRCCNGVTALHWAAAQGDKEIAEFLLERGADINAREGTEDIMPLGWAMVDSQDELDRELVVCLIERGANLNVRDERGRTPLIWAIEMNDLDLARLMLSNGADPSGRDEWGLSPLVRAMRNENIECVWLLVAYRADLNVRDSWSSVTPLLWAMQKGDSDLVLLMLEHGAGVGVRIVHENRYNMPPLHWAAAHGHEQIVRFLLEHAMSWVNDRCCCGLTPLHWAVRGRHEVIAHFLLRRGANIHAQGGRHAQMPIHCANHGNMVRFLLGHGVDVDAESGDKETPLACCTDQKSTDALQALLDHGAHIEAKNVSGYTPLYAVAARREPDRVKLRLLVQRGARLTQNVLELLCKDPTLRAELATNAQQRQQTVRRCLEQNGFYKDLIAWFEREIMGEGEPSMYRSIS